MRRPDSLVGVKRFCPRSCLGFSWLLANELWAVCFLSSTGSREGSSTLQMTSESSRRHLVWFMDSSRPASAQAQTTTQATRSSFRVLTGSWRKILITGNRCTEALASIKVEAMRVNSKVPTGTRVLPKPDG